MALEDTELKIGNTSFKGVYIAILLSLATTLGGGVWTASSLYSRLTAVEAVEIPDNWAYTATAHRQRCEPT